MQTGCSVGTESCGVAVSGLTLHQHTQLSPPLHLQRGIWELLLISWRCAWWCVTSCRRSNSCLLQHCWSSWISAWCPAWGYGLTTPSSPRSAPESRRRLKKSRPMFKIGEKSNTATNSSSLPLHCRNSRWMQQKSPETQNVHSEVHHNNGKILLYSYFHSSKFRLGLICFSFFYVFFYTSCSSSPSSLQWLAIIISCSHSAFWPGRN